MTKKPNATATLEAELASLQRRRASLQDRHDRAEAALDAAKAARRAILTGEDDPAPAKLAAADKAVRDADDARQAAAEAGDEIGALIETASTRLATVLEAEQREQGAAEIEGGAAAAESAVLRMRKAAKEIAAAHQALVEAMGPSCAGLYAAPTGDPNLSWMTFLGTSFFSASHDDTREIQASISPEETASRIAGHILGPILPGCAITSSEELAQSNKPLGPTQMLMPIDDADRIASLMVDPMRAYAAALRSGAAALPRHVTAASVSDAARVPVSHMPDMYKVDQHGNAFDMQGNPLSRQGAAAASAA